MIDVVSVHPLGEHRLEIAFSDFSDGTLEVRDFSSLSEKTGALAWPNGYDRIRKRCPTRSRRRGC